MTTRCPMSKPSTIGADSRSGSTSTKSRPLRAVSSRGELIAHAAVFRNDGQLQSLAYEHLDLRLHPPYRSSLDRHDAPYSKIDYARLKAVLPYMMLDNDKDKSGNGLTHLCDLGFERGFMRCFLDYAPPADPWDHRRLLCRVPVADISTVVGVDVTETRIFKAYRSHLATQSTSTALRLFSTPTPVMRIPTYTSTVLDGIIHIQRFEPIPLPTVEFNPGSALFQEAIDELSPEIRHELHLRHCCPWTSVISSSGPVCRCPNYSKDNPRTRLPRLLPEIVFGIDGAAYRKKEIQARLIDPDYLRALQLEHGLDAWTKGMAKFAGPTTRSCVSQALTRLLAAYEMCGSVYGAAVVATRFTRLFILGPNRVAMEILSDGRMLAGNIPKPLPWTRKDQNEAKMSYAEKATPAPAVSPAVEFKRRVLSETRPLPARLSGICKPSRVVSQPPPRSDHSGLLDCGISTPGGIPPPHVLQSPRSKVSWYKALLLGGRGDVQAPLSPHPSDQSPRSSLTSSATLTPNIEKRLPTLPPPPPDPVCVLPPDSRPGIPFHRMFGQDLLNRLPWSFVVSSNTLPGKEGQAQTTVDMDAVHAFSNLLTAALIRVGQVPYECGTRRTGPLPPGPLPTTNYYPRAEAVAALAETTRIPLELAERIVDNSIVVDEQPHVRAWRQNNWKIPDTVDSLSSIRALDKDFKRNSRWQTSHTPDIVAMERALQDTVTFVPVSRGEMEALIGRQVRADRRQYFRTFPTSAWPAYWDS